MTHHMPYLRITLKGETESLIVHPLINLENNSEKYVKKTAPEYAQEAKGGKRHFQPVYLGQLGMGC